MSKKFYSQYPDDAYLVLNDNGFFKLKFNAELWETELKNMSFDELFEYYGYAQYLAIKKGDY